MIEVMDKGIELFKVKVLACYIFLFAHCLAYSQNSMNTLSVVPSEKVYVHINSSLVFTGEYLLYSLYCLDNISLKPSEISKIAYVELIGEDFKPVFKHKLRLNGGRSYADFFVPTSVPSGNYKLLAYTSWMRNFGLERYFKQDVTIINPYQGDQSVFLKAESDTDGIYIAQKTKVLPNDKPANSGERNLKIDLNGKEFKTRKEVVLSLINNSKKNIGYDLSISVRKIDKLPIAERVSTNSLTTEPAYSDNISMNKGNYPYLPELRGKLFSGRVLHNETMNPIGGKGVSLSLPKNNTYFQTAYTDENGIFHFSLQEEYEATNGILQVLDKNSDNYQVNMLDSPKIDYKTLTFDDFRLSRIMEDQILERSFHNQIENSFFNIKPDTIQSKAKKEAFFLDNSLDYILDDYTRFPTLRETVVEIIKNLWIIRDSEGNRVFKVRVNPPYNESDKSPLLMIDGIHVQNHEAVMEFNAGLIKKIRIGRNRFVFGKDVFEGSISIETNGGNYTPMYDNIAITNVPLFTPEPKKSYFKQVYKDLDNSTSKRIPDFRSQLFWIPIESIKGTKRFSFYTSDVTGDFEVVIEGFSNDGSNISLKEMITIK